MSNFDFVPAQNNSTIDFLTKSLMPVQNIVFSVKNNIFTVEEGAICNLRFSALSSSERCEKKSESLMDAVASRHVVGEIKHCENLSEVLLKRLLYRHSNMGDSSDSDAEEDSMLREALDSETRGLYYFQKSSFL